ncbi:hypothetical protein [Paraliobacillus ryukyuensis]|uniref:hypothetical protein n=1 Tax=Paraliobacillus ryukyuensis TaxID=200904 RepID=UPI0009A6C808|nr:hypothetical protein [Paraliobacillus ryukyuensis]
MEIKDFKDKFIEGEKVSYKETFLHILDIYINNKTLSTLLILAILTAPFAFIIPGAVQGWLHVSLLLATFFGLLFGIFRSIKHSLSYKTKDNMKQEMKDWIKKNYKFNHATQYEKLAVCLKREITKKEFYLDFDMFYKVFIPAWIAYMVFEWNNNPSSIPQTILTTVLLFFMLWVIKFTINTIIDEYVLSKHNHRYRRFQKILTILDEIIIEASIEEHHS